MAGLDWNGYRIDKPGNETSLLDTVSHTAHTADARRIIEDGTIRPQLVSDKSILRDYRLPVIWTSPNYWHPGFMYGTASFSFDFRQAIEGCRFFWVESMPEYNPTALRILVTKEDYKSRFGLDLPEFNPCELGNPLFFDGNHWHWLFRYNYEIMFDVPFSVDRAIDLTFVDHNTGFCNRQANKDARLCADKDVRRTRRQIVSLALAGALPNLKRLLTKDNSSIQSVIEKFVDDFFYRWLIPSMDMSETVADPNEEFYQIFLALHALGGGNEDLALGALKEIGDPFAIKQVVSVLIENTFGQIGQSIFETETSSIEAPKPHSATNEGPSNQGNPSSTS